MALFDRWKPAATDRVSTHEFYSWLHIYLNDSAGLGSIAAVRAVASMALEADEIAEVAAMKLVFDALGAAGKVEYAGRIHAAALLVEGGQITASEMNTLLGI